MTIASGTRLGRYKLISPLGAGGMGEVYLAQDTKLDRKVALKILPPEFAENADRMSRFVREAKSASALNHPNIITIYEIGEADGTHFIATEFIDGKTLGDYAKANPLSFKSALEIAIQVASALEEAHTAGIVHRDIKPDNVMVRSNGLAKILDFGIAKLSAPTSTDGEAATAIQSNTQAGMIIGTPQFMSPEQARGKGVDHQTDIFSFGVVLYEMLSGASPFKGETVSDVIAAVLTKEARPLADIPPELAAIVQKTLQKDKQKRYQSAKELLDDLREVKQELEIRDRLGRNSAPNLEEPQTQILQAPTTAEKSPASTTDSEDGFWVAVLPFKYRGANADLEDLAEGLSEEIITGLSRFSYLRVIAHSSTLRYTGEGTDIRAVGKELGARYVLEGSLRQVGTTIRIAAQLVETMTGEHLWAETYDRQFESERIFELQDELVPRIVSTVADWYGVLPNSMSEIVRLKSPEKLSPYETLLRFFGYNLRITAEEHLETRNSLEQAVSRAPGNADCWAMLSTIYVDEYKFGYNPKPDSLKRSLAAALRAVESAPSNPSAHYALAQARFFRKEFVAFRSAAERAIALNPMDGAIIGYMGMLIAYSGDWERGCELAERAIQMNPHHPGWFWNTLLHRAYIEKDYQQALSFALKMNMPGFYYYHLHLAAVYGQLGEYELAAQPVRDLLELKPDIEFTVRDDLSMWTASPEFVEHEIEGLRKAGLKIAAAPNQEEPKTQILQAATTAEKSPTSNTKSEDGFWVAVLPFKYRGANADLVDLAEGLSEEIITGLSRFSYLRVIAHSSTLRFTGEMTDIRTVGKELGAHYVLEGNLRQSGSTVRIATQLVDTTTGAHLWAETYDSQFQSGNVFAIQDELVPRIVSTVADQHGVLVHSITGAIRKKDKSRITPSEAVMSVFSFHERMTAEEHLVVRDLLERIVREFPDEGNCWAMLETLYCDEYMFEFNVRPDSLGRALAAAQRAVESAPTSNLACQALAQARFFRKEFDAFRPLAERTIVLNPMDGATVAFMGVLIACAGEWERGCEVTRQAMHLNPHFPGWYRIAVLLDAYRRGDYREALNEAQRFNIPNYFWTLVMRAAALGQLGEQKAAQAALKELLASRPDFAEKDPEEFLRWLDAELVEHLMDGLRKAGLESNDNSGKTGLAKARYASGEQRVDEGFWVAVLPFSAAGGNAELKSFAEGLSEEIVTGLSRFSYLKVIARGSTLRFADEAADIRAIGRELGARYVLEGNLRQVGATMRLAMHLVDTANGVQLWSENYQRAFSSEALFDLQDELVPRIVSTVADWYGVLPHFMSEFVRLKSPEKLSPYEALLRSFGYTARLSPEDHLETRDILERAVGKSPENADCWAMLSTIYADEYKFGYNPKPDPLKRTLAAALRAVEAAPSNSFANYALAQARFFRKEFDAFRSAAERAIALNPMNGAVAAYMGQLLHHAGDRTRGCELSEKARQLNPQHPGWYWVVPFHQAYETQDYRLALSYVLKMNMPGLFFYHVHLTATYGQLGEHQLAAQSARDLLAIVPNFELIARNFAEMWVNSETVEHLIEGLRKAGLKIAAAPNLEEPQTQILQAPTTAEKSPASTTDSEEGFWVAVLPFKYRGENADLEALAEGLSEEIVTGLSRFSYLKVIARGSTLSYTGDAGDIRTIGKEIGARYVLEGSLRQAGAVLRVAVQLVDASTGAHLWAETYNRTFSSEAVFELQDDLVPLIVSTVADQYGALVHSMSESLRGKSVGQYSAYEAVLRTFGYLERITPEEHREVRAILEAVVSDAPGQSDCQSMLSLIYWHEYANGYNVKPDSLGRALAAARQATAIAPTNHLAHYALACVFFFQKDFASFRPAAERALALNRMDASTTAFLGILIAYSGDWEYGLSVVERAMRLNPHHAGWYHFPAFHYAYHRRDYRGALEIALKVNMPGYFFAHTALAAVYGQLGEQERARAELRELHALMPNFSALAGEEYGKWFDPELTEHLLDGLSKAGLELESTQKQEEQKTQSLKVSTTAEEQPTKVGTQNSIAVLPFTNMSADEDNEYFCDGLAEELLNALSKIDDLKVAARTSAFSFKGKNANASEIGEKLSVNNILEGSVRRSGNRLRISVQLVNSADGYQLWSERYDREMKDIFDVQDEIALAVVDALKVKLFGDEKAAVLKRYTDDAEVHELFLKGRYYSYKYTAEGWKRAIEFFEKAIEKQPDFAPAYAGIAAAAGCLWFFGFLPAEETIPQSKKATARALELDENLAEAYLSSALLTYSYDWQWQKAEREFKQSIALNPNYAEALSHYAVFLGFAERFEEAVSRGRRALEIDPLSPLININVGWAYFSLGLSNEALELAEKMIEIEPDLYGAYWLKGAIRLSKGEYEAAARELKKAVSLGGRQIVLSDLASAYGLAGETGEAAAILEQLLEMRRVEYVPAICLARVYSRLGENDKTIEWLEKAFEERNGEMVFLQGEIEGAAEGDALHSLADDPRLIEILNKMKLP